MFANRADIRQAELHLSAAKVDVQAAREKFYPSFEIKPVLAFQAFKPAYLVRYLESVLYSLAGDLAGPLINRNAIQAEFANANARQVQTMYILNAYMEVSTRLSGTENLSKRYDLKMQQLEGLTHK